MHAHTYIRICVYLYVCINMLYILPIEPCILSYITRVLGALRSARQDGARSIRLACFVPRICVCETWLIRMRDTTHSTWDMCRWDWSSFLRLVWLLGCVCTWAGDSWTWGTRHILLGKCQIDRAYYLPCSYDVCVWGCVSRWYEEHDSFYVGHDSFYVGGEWVIWHVRYCSLILVCSYNLCVGGDVTYLSR